MITGVSYYNGFLSNAQEVFDLLDQSVQWDNRMTARKTASFGVAYNYSQMSYPYREMLPILKQLCEDADRLLGFEPNNCLINYYMDGSSKMGFHSDQTDILEKGTGVIIVSLGAVRILRFRNIADKELTEDFELLPGLFIVHDTGCTTRMDARCPQVSKQRSTNEFNFKENIISSRNDIEKDIRDRC